jgi:hypothetical protein
MSIARDRSLQFFSVLFSIGMLASLGGCSSPKAAGPAVRRGAAAVEAAASPNPAPSDPGVQADPFVATVRAGTMSGYPQATIGPAFEAAFSKTHWSSQQSKAGARIVTFTGFLPANMRPDCGAMKAGSSVPPCVQNAGVTFEWTFAPDGHVFHLSMVDPEAWPATHRSTREMMLYIFG